MFTVLKQMRRVGLAAVALGSIGISGQAFAVGTNSGDTITNTATVNYSVSSVAQTPVSAADSFVVDTIVRFNLTGGATVDVAPGQLNNAQAFILTNTSNATSQFTLTATNDSSGDNFDMNQPGTATPGLLIYADTDGNGVYTPGTDLQVTSNVTLTTVAPNDSARYFVVGDTPIGRINGNTAAITLLATAINPATGSAWVNDTAADIKIGANSNQIVVGNGTATRPGTFRVQTATLAVTKTSSIVSDPINGTSTARKAIPGSVMQYEIKVENSGSKDATLQNITDAVPVQTVFLPGAYPGSRDVEIVVGSAPATYCVAESGSDGNGDGCFLTGATLTVQSPAINTVTAGSQVTVRFQVTIQ